jgi:hypothetical protein
VIPSHFNGGINMSDIVIGSVTGTGVALKVPVGFQPRVVELYNFTSANLETMLWMNGMTAAYALKKKDSTFSKATSNGITLYAGGAALPADDDMILNSVALTNTSFSLNGQPDQPRKLTLTITDTTASITVGHITLTGKDKDGTAVTEVINCAAGAGVYTSVYKYYTVTTIVAADFATLGGTSDELIKVGYLDPSDGTVEYLSEGFIIGADSDMNVAGEVILYKAYR